MKKTLGVYIGRFQPFHNGHQAILYAALQKYDHVLVLIGSTDQPRTIKNPWSYQERADMIYSCGYRSVYTLPIRDFPYDDQKWIELVSQTIETHMMMVGPSEVSIIGCEKDASSFYLKEFPQYGLDIEVPTTWDKWCSKTRLSATEIRGEYFSEFGHEIYQVPSPVQKFMDAFKVSTTVFNYLRKEYEFNNNYRFMWEKTPYPVIFQTVDSLVVQNGKILLIRRKTVPGKGLWALPGGYLDPDEYQLDGAIRELKEETSLHINKACLKADKVFDKPDRSLRGRVITRAFLFVLPNDMEAHVKGGDDAAEARWFPLSDALGMSQQLFEDHHAIIETMLEYL